ncbi:hypothetical protein Tco_1393639 [Tanacetum coccineum]
MAKGCQVFLAQISAKKEEDKSKRKQIKDVPIVRDFPKVFPEDLPGSSIYLKIRLRSGLSPVRVREHDIPKDGISNRLVWPLRVPAKVVPEQDKWQGHGIMPQVSADRDGKIHFTFLGDLFKKLWLGVSKAKGRKGTCHWPSFHTTTVIRCIKGAAYEDVWSKCRSRVDGPTVGETNCEWPRNSIKKQQKRSYDTQKDASCTGSKTRATLIGNKKSIRSSRLGGRVMLLGVSKSGKVLPYRLELPSRV